MRQAHVLRGIGATVLALSLGCTATRTRTKVTEPWTDTSYAARPMNTVVVFGPNIPPKTRHEVEDRLVSDLEDKGVRAEPSYEIFGDEPPDRTTAREKLMRNYDGALVVDFEQVESTAKSAPLDNFFAIPYGTPYESPYQPSPKLQTEYTMDVDTTLWDLREDRRVWNATMKVENPLTRRDFAKRLSKRVVPELATRGFIGR
jgi:hypothetical protein